MEFKFKSILELIKAFPNEETCLEFLKQSRWAEGEYCPHCGHTKIYAFSDGKNYKCASCRKRFSVKVGTVFEDTKIPLQKWFMAVYLLTAHKKGISSLQLARDIDVTQKTAWFMLHRLRHASDTKAFNEPLRNTVEVDETYVGGKEKNKHHDKRTKGTQGRNTDTKTAVMGMVERGGNVMAMSVPSVQNNMVQRTVLDNVIIGSNLMTDEFSPYKKLRSYYNHQAVRHSAGQYVSGIAHTNTIEGFWSLFKRGVVGIYHFVSKKHLDRYLTEYTYRYNTRNLSESARFRNLMENCNGRLTYNQLTARAA